MNTRYQIGVIAPEADLQALIESVRSAAHSLPETLELIPCAAGTTMATMVLAGADALIAGASIEVVSDDQKLIRVLQTIRDVRLNERRRSLLGVMLWGTRAPELAENTNHYGLLSPPLVASATPPQELLRQRLLEAMPLLNSINAETRYHLLASAAGNVRLPLSRTSTEEMGSVIPIVSTEEPSGLFGYFRSLLPSERKKHQRELEAMRQLINRLRQEQSNAARRHHQLEASQQHLKYLYNSLELEKERLHNENQNLNLQVEASHDEHRRVLESARREIARASGDSAVKIAETERRLVEVIQQLSIRDQKLSEMTQELSEKDHQIESLHEQLSVVTSSLEIASSELALAKVDAESTHAAIKLAQAGAIVLRDQVVDALQEVVLTQVMLTSLTSRQTGELHRIETGPLQETEVRREPVTHPLPVIPSQPEPMEFSTPTISPVLNVTVYPIVNEVPVQQNIAVQASSNHEVANNWSRVDLSELFQELKEKSNSLMAGRRIQLDTEIESEAGQVHSDPNLLRETMFDLMAAAIHSVKEGMIMITARRTADSITLSITDTGKGIPKEKLNQLLSQEEGYQAGSMTESAIISVHRQAAAMNARLRVRSFLNFGTTVSLLLEPEIKVMSGSVGKLN